MGAPRNRHFYGFFQLRGSGHQLFRQWSAIQGRRFQVQAGQNPYASGHLYQNGQTITANDKCLMVIWLRSPTPDAQVNIFAENASSWPVGTYILTLVNAGKQRTERFVVQH